MLYIVIYYEKLRKVMQGIEEEALIIYYILTLSAMITGSTMTSQCTTQCQSPRAAHGFLTSHPGGYDNGVHTH